jgi:hypothetical protein
MKGAGKVYKASGNGTRSGKPYVARTSNPRGPKGRGKRDGRARSDHEIVDTYNNTREGKIKEQRHIDKDGLENLDNKRNEIAPSKRGDYGLDD